METNCHLTLKSKVKESVVTDLMLFLKANLPNVRNFEGCVSVEGVFNQEDNEVLFYEVWVSKAHHTRYLEFISGNGVMNELASFLLALPLIEYYNQTNL